MNDVESFFKGYKPALLYNPNYKIMQIYTNDQLEQLNQFPNTSVQIFEMNQLLYFQDNDLKQLFIDKTKDLELDSPSYHKEVGITLGFPPPAADFFSKHFRDPDWEYKKVSVHYCGIGFVTSPEHFDQDIKWLWDHTPIPDSEPFRQDTKIGFHLQRNNDLMKLEIRTENYHQLKFATTVIEKALDSPVPQDYEY